MHKKIILIVAVLTFVFGASFALADPAAFGVFTTRYPGTAYDCTVCHGPGGPPTNPYGAALAPLPVTDAELAAIENVDSDGDTFTNLAEIQAGSLPGDPASVPGVAFEVTAPAAGESVPTGAAYAVTWTAATGAASYKVKLSIDGGLTWSTLGKGLSGTTTTWNVPTTIKKNITNAIIKVIAFNNNNISLGAAKSGTFSIDVLTIDAPAAGQIVPQNAPFNITWTANGTAAPPDQVTVKYSLNNGTTWKTADGTLGASSFSWNVPVVANPKTKARVQVKLKVAGVLVAKAVSAKFTVQ